MFSRSVSAVKLFLLAAALLFLALAHSVSAEIDEGHTPAKPPEEGVPGPRGAAGPGDGQTGGVAEDPGSMAARLFELFKRGQDVDVVHMGEEHLKSVPGDVESRLAVSRALARLGALAADPLFRQTYFTRAFNHLQAARSREPGRLEVRIGICDILYHLDRHDSLLAEDELARNETAFYGEQYLADGKAKPAADVFSLVARSWPTDDKIAANHGTALVLTGDLDAGLRELERAVGLDPANADAVRNLAQGYLHRGEPKRALEMFRAAHEARPESGRFVLDLAVVTAITDADAAVPLFEKAAEILGSKDPQEILVRKLQIGMTSPRLAPSDLHRLASELDQAGYPVYALAAAEKALRLDSSLIDTVLLRADINRKRLFFARSLEDYRLARTLIDDQPATRSETLLMAVTGGEARGLVETGKPDEALVLLKATGHPERFPFELADALHGTGDTAGAIVILEKISRSGNDPGAAEAAQRRLSEMAGVRP
jgi:tetratricopeptide (TPR) repeat protein